MNFFRKNIGLKIVSLIIGLIFWDYVESQVLLADHVQVPFEVLLQGLPDELTASAPARVTVQATGPPDLIKEVQSHMAADLNAHKLILTVDLSRASAGQNQYRAHIDSPYEGVTWQNAVVQVDLEEKHSTHKMKIGVEALSLPTGFSLDHSNTTVTPPQAIATGRLSDIVKVDHLSVELQIARLEPGKTYRNLIVEAKDAGGQPVSNVTVDPSTVDVQPQLIRASGQKNVSIAVKYEGQLPPGVEITKIKVVPNIKLISGQPDEVNQVDMISTSPVNLDDIKKDTVVTVHLRAPEQQVDFDRKPVKVYISVHKFATQAPVAAPAKPPSSQVTTPSAPAH